MKLTPLDIHHKEFRRSLRGYDEKEVDDFLDAVADEFERLFKENIDLSERLEAANNRVRSYQEMETTLQNTLLSAQRSAEDIVAKSREEAETLLRDAEVKAKEVIHDALVQKQKTAAELLRIKQAEEQFRTQYKTMLEQHLAGVSEVTLPDDIRVMVAETDDGVVADVDVAEPPAAFEYTPSAEPAAAPPAPRAEPESEWVIDDLEDVDLVLEPGATQAMPAVDEAVEEDEADEGFVSGLTLGETEPPELPVDVEIEEPREFTLGSLDALGEREDDIDIEEID